MVNYSGRYLIFDLKGSFKGQVIFSGACDGFRGDKVQLKTVSDSGKFFVFEGPRFLSKDQREKIKSQKKAVKQMKSQVNEEGIMSTIALAALNIIQKAKKTAPKGKKTSARIFYVFKLEKRK